MLAILKNSCYAVTWLTAVGAIIANAGVIANSLITDVTTFSQPILKAAQQSKFQLKWNVAYGNFERGLTSW